MDPMISETEKPVRPRALIKPMLILVIVAALVLGGVVGWQLFIGKMTKKYMSAAATTPQSVSTAVVATSTWQSTIEALGSLRAVRGADLAAQASGVVDTLHIDSGADVAAGSVLLTLKLNDDPAKLVAYQAAQEIAEINLKRDQEQLAVQAIAKQTVDSDASTLKSSRAQVAEQRALIDEKIVRAPFAGRLGLRQVDEGQYLAAGTTVVTLQALDPIFIDFYVPQQTLAHIKVGQTVSAGIDTYPKDHFAGKVVSINSKVDSTSRNVQVRASFGNTDRRLLPGMYANVRVDNGETTTQLTLPQAAITYNPYGDTVYVVAKDGKDDKNNDKLVVNQRFVKLGATRGDQVAVVSGVAAGDEVVTAGQMKLRNGAPVTVNNSVQPSNDSNPTPPNE